MSNPQPTAPTSLSILPSDVLRLIMYLLPSSSAVALSSTCATARAVLDPVTLQAIKKAYVPDCSMCERAAKDRSSCDECGAIVCDDCQVNEDAIDFCDRCETRFCRKVNEDEVCYDCDYYRRRRFESTESNESDEEGDTTAATS